MECVGSVVLARQCAIAVSRRSQGRTPEVHTIGQDTSKEEEAVFWEALGGQPGTTDDVDPSVAVEDANDPFENVLCNGVRVYEVCAVLLFACCMHLQRTRGRS